MTRIAIAGGGLAGSLVALALANRRPDVDFVLVEQGDRFGGNHTWSFFDSDVPDDQCWLLKGLIASSWPDHEVRFPARRRTIALGYNSIRSENLDRIVRRTLRRDQYRLGASVAALGETSILLDSGERIDADAVIDARGPEPMPGIELGWQKFAGQVVRFDGGHGVERPMIMDATVDQSDGYRFIYLLPFSSTELLIEDTYYSTTADLDLDAIVAKLADYARTLTGTTGVVIAEEAGVLPVVIGGDVASLWHGAQVPMLGLRGGFFHLTTGYSLPDAVANAILLTEQDDLTTAALLKVYRQRAERLWAERGFFKLLNRMLFRAAEPETRYRVLEHFYRLPAPVIARFYGARLTSLDKLRILSGRPPVPIGRALSAMRRRAA
ncbi:lycopene beta-cyclase CrtY [Sphingomonas sinipercae]|uniref:Lycopene beta-cyclase CrtY n=1 Tax=Sphingomonas sinipercae TaxID=2714944 RepID=A0A6G7ZM83_9SPHN|nr:lycopene beta-cyclase CrtY [Sphingomonas sinipercae]QIL02107.1 lycopene beta-cyclase CrtY [Sphingomonas sinipercae]